MGTTDCSKDSFCSVCQYPFTSTMTKTPSKHLASCKQRKLSTKMKCPEGVDCISTLESHYQIFSHEELAKYRKTSFETSRTGPLEGQPELTLFNIMNGRSTIKSEPVTRAHGSCVGPESIVDLTDSQTSSQEFQNTPTPRKDSRSLSRTSSSSTGSNAPRSQRSSQTTFAKHKLNQTTNSSKHNPKRRKLFSQFSKLSSPQKERSTQTIKFKKERKIVKKFESKTPMTVNPWSIASSQKKSRTPLKKTEIEVCDVIDLTQDDEDTDQASPISTTISVSPRRSPRNLPRYVTPPKPNKSSPGGQEISSSKSFVDPLDGCETRIKRLFARDSSTPSKSKLGDGETCIKGVFARDGSIPPKSKLGDGEICIQGVFARDSSTPSKLKLGGGETCIKGVFARDRSILPKSKLGDVETCIKGLFARDSSIPPKLKLGGGETCIKGVFARDSSISSKSKLGDSETCIKGVFATGSSTFSKSKADKRFPVVRIERMCSKLNGDQSEENLAKSSDKLSKSELFAEKIVSKSSISDIQFQSTQAPSNDTAPSVSLSTMETGDSEDWSIPLPRGPGFVPISPIMGDFGSVMSDSNSVDIFADLLDKNEDSTHVPEIHDDLSKTITKYTENQVKNDKITATSDLPVKDSIAPPGGAQKGKTGQGNCESTTDGTTKGSVSSNLVDAGIKDPEDILVDSMDYSLLSGLAEDQTMLFVNQMLSAFLKKQPDKISDSKSSSHDPDLPTTSETLFKPRNGATTSKTSLKSRNGTSSNPRKDKIILPKMSETSYKARNGTASNPGKNHVPLPMTSEASSMPRNGTTSILPKDHVILPTTSKTSIPANGTSLNHTLPASCTNASNSRKTMPETSKSSLLSNKGMNVTKTVAKQGDIGAMLFGMKPKVKQEPLKTDERSNGWKNRTGQWRNGFNGGSKNSQRECPFYKKVSGTDIAVDAFNYGMVKGIRFYFLSHFHSDHYMGLNKKTWRQKIYCGRVTGNLVVRKLRIPEILIFRLAMWKETPVGDVAVTLLEANHCPGAVLFLFKLRNNRVILHTGDFRAQSEMEEYSSLQSVKIETLYLDTTYLNSKYKFPPQCEVIKAVASLATKAMSENPRTLIVVGTYLIGKERVFSAVAKTVRSRVFVTLDKFRIIQCLEDDDLSKMVTTKPDDVSVHVIAMRGVNVKNLTSRLSKYPKFERIVAFKPTGWTHNGCSPSLDQIKPVVSGPISIYGVPYSEHSSFEDLQRFVKFLRPSRIIPTVNVGQKDTRDAMNFYLDKWKRGLDPD